MRTVICHPWHPWQASQIDQGAFGAVQRQAPVHSTEAVTTPLLMCYSEGNTSDVPVSFWGFKIKNAEHLARASGQGRIAIKNGGMRSPVWPHYKWSVPSACKTTALVLITTQMQGKVRICHGISPGLLVYGALPFRCFHPLIGLKKCLCLASTQTPQLSQFNRNPTGTEFFSFLPMFSCYLQGSEGLREHQCIVLFINLTVEEQPLQI